MFNNEADPQFNNEEEKRFFDALYEDYFDLLFRICKGPLHGDMDAVANCVHAVFDVAQRKVQLLMHHPNVGGWMHTTAKNCIQKEYQRLKRERTKYERLIRSVSHVTIDELISEEELARIQSSVLGRLNEAEREIHQLYYIENLSLAQISERLGISVGAAKMRIYRVKLKLESLLSDYI